MNTYLETQFSEETVIVSETERCGVYRERERERTEETEKGKSQLSMLMLM